MKVPGVHLASLLFVSAGFRTAHASFNAWPAEQTAFAHNTPIGVSLGTELNSLPTDQFAILSHPAFPGRSARIKKSNFCDGNVTSYTGYIDVGARHLFFYFFESRSDPDNDDVVLWTNGGPGGSSAVGLFMELGPCWIDSGNKTKYNPYSWNSNANIFFIDQPIGTGFSYADFGEAVATSEESAKDIAAFVATFFETFTKFKGRAFHLTGESYAGRYLPVYAAEIYDQNAFLVEKGLTPVNLQSVAIGSGAVDFFQLILSHYDFACTRTSVEPVLPVKTCVRMKQAVPRCKKQIQRHCVDSLDFIDCKAAVDFCSAEVSEPFDTTGLNPYDLTKKCAKDNQLCYEEGLLIEEYLNQPWVQESLGVDPAARNFSNISWKVNTAFWDSGDAFHLNQLYVSELLEHGVRVLIYVGTYDFSVNWIGCERWVHAMEWSGQEGFRAEHLKEWTADGNPAGEFKTFGNLTFATIYGAGHMAPHDKPVESLEMINRWLSDKSF